MKGRDYLLPMLFQFVGFALFVLGWIVIFGGRTDRHVFGALLLVPGVLLWIGNAIVLELRKIHKGPRAPRPHRNHTTAGFPAANTNLDETASYNPADEAGVEQ